MRVLIFLSILITISCKSDVANNYNPEKTLRDIELSEALPMMEDSKYVVIDIRTPEEIADGKIVERALEMDFYADDFKSKMDALDKEKSYIIYCRSGGRSGKTLKMMSDMNFTSGYNVLGGYNAYKEINKK